MPVPGDFPLASGMKITDIARCVHAVYLHKKTQETYGPVYTPRVAVNVQDSALQSPIKINNKAIKLLSSDVRIDFEEEGRGVLFFEFDAEVMEGYGISTEHLGVYLCKGSKEWVLPTTDTGLGFLGLRTPDIDFVFGQRDVFVLRFAHANGPASFLRVNVECDEPPAPLVWEPSTLPVEEPPTPPV